MEKNTVWMYNIKLCVENMQLIIMQEMGAAMCFYSNYTILNTFFYAYHSKTLSYQ